MGQINKAKYWVAVCYPENMKDNWEEDIGDILQLPYSYCKHTADLDGKSEHRKDHVHIILIFPNTTTHKHALSVFDLLSAGGFTCVNTCQAIIHIRGMYDYLIHDTETCRKKGKHLYPKESRINGNNFDIGAYEQLSVLDKDLICKELCEVILDNFICNFGDFYMYVIGNYEDINYFESIKSYSGLYERLIKSNCMRAKGTSLETYF